jgi:hypothetical protein
MHARLARQRQRDARERALLEAEMSDELDSDNDGSGRGWLRLRLYCTVLCCAVLCCLVATVTMPVLILVCLFVFFCCFAVDVAIEHDSKSSRSLMARSRTSASVGGGDDDDDDATEYQDDESVGSGASQQRRGRSSMGINMSASGDGVKGSDSKRYHLKALDEWARDAAIGKVKGKFKRRHVDKRLKGSRSNSVVGEGEAMVDSGSEEEDNPSHTFGGGRPSTFGVETGTASWNVDDALKDENLLESTLLMTEEEEAAMLAKLKADKEAAIVARRKKELARLRGEVVVGGGDSDDDEGEEKEDEETASEGRDVPKMMAGAHAAVSTHFYSSSSPNDAAAVQGNVDSEDEEEKPMRHVSMISVDNFGVHDINNC